MSEVQMVRALVTQRLAAAVEEIFGLFERTIGEYEEELCRSKEKNERQQKLLDAVLKPEVRLHRADIQQLVVKEAVPPEQQEWSPSLDQEDPPEPPHIKEEQEELWTSQEGEQLEVLEEAAITKFLFTPVPAKREDDEEKPQSSQLHQRQTEQMETGADGEDCGGPEPARNLHPDPHLQPETEDCEDWNDTTEHESSVNLDIEQLVVDKEEVPPEQQEWSPSLDQEDPPEPPHIKEEQEELWTSQEGEQLQGLEEADITKFLFTPVPVKSEDDEEKNQSSQLHQRQAEQMETGAEGEDCGGPEPARNSHPDPHLQPETEDSKDWNDTTEHESSVNLGKKPFGYSKCGKRFYPRLILKRLKSLTRHTSVNTGDRRFNCSVCNKRFTRFTDVQNHKCVSPQSSQLHQKDKTEDSSDTEDSDDWSKDSREPPSGSKSLKINEVSKSGVRCNTEENPLSCSQHMFVHSDEKPFQCSVCGKAFTQKHHMTQHMTVHTGEKTFCCSVCDQRFTWCHQLAKHKSVCPESSQLHLTEQNREVLWRTRTSQELASRFLN